MPAASFNFSVSGSSTVRLILSGDWLLSEPLPETAQLTEALAGEPPPQRIEIDATALGQWDTGLTSTLVPMLRHARAHDMQVDTSALPAGAQRLLEMAFAVAPTDTGRGAAREPLLARIGQRAVAAAAAGRELTTFVGEVAQSFGRLLRGRATLQRADVAVYVQEAGAEALPIASLISFLIGMIFAFVGVMQLEPFGAGIYTADLVAIAMIREMAPIMTAILMAGRTGAAYAAQIGTMKVNEEVDALTTLGIEPVDFLVLPRVIALVLMLPLLSLYASFMGILGGMVVGLSMLDVSFMQYLNQTLQAGALTHLFGGLFKALVFGALIAMAGCQQGMACGGSAMAVGQSTTRAVVMGIVLIVVSAAVLTIIYINLGI